MNVKRLRVFAGPNGSGKSTITSIVREAGVSLGIYVNADEMKKIINATKTFDFSHYLKTFDESHFKQSFSESSLFIKAGGDDMCNACYVDGCIMHFRCEVNDYFTSFLSAYLREALLDNCDKFTFETVMSHPSKLEYIRKARSKGFRVYLYFVALENPSLNRERVQARVKLGGHDVPDDKVVERYARSLNLMLSAIRLSDRACIFDNSSSKPLLLASVNDGELTMADGVEYIPSWFKRYLIDKL